MTNAEALGAVLSAMDDACCLAAGFYKVGEGTISHVPYEEIFLAAWDAHNRPLVLPIRGAGFNR